MSNPLLSSFTGPFNTAPFSEISTAHFQPAFIAAIEEAKKEIEAIKLESLPTFENTVEALEKSGKHLGILSALFFNLNSAETNAELQGLAREISPLLTAHANDVLLDQELFQRIAQVYEQKESLSLTAEQSTLLEKTYKSFVRNGAQLGAADAETLRRIDQELAQLSLQFGEHVLAETNRFLHLVDQKSELEGLPQGALEAAAQLAEEKGHAGSWAFSLDYPSYIPVMTYADAMLLYGNDKPDLRWTAPLVTLKGGQAYGASPFPGPGVEGVGFGVFEEAEAVIGVPVPGGAGWTRKELDALTEWVKRPQIGMKGMVWLRCEAGEATYRSSVDKFYGADHLKAWMDAAGLGSGDLMLVLAGPEALTRKAAAELRLEIGTRLGFRSPDQYRALWVVDFPLLDWDEESGRWVAMHHPFTSPLPEDMDLMQNHPGRVRANAYDMVLNGTEIGGGSIRIHDKGLQARLFELLGFGAEEAQAKFGFLLKAFEYGAPPHGGIAFGFDRLCALFGGQESIRDFIAFPKNNAGRDVMIDAPSGIDEVQRKELGLP